MSRFFSLHFSHDREDGRQGESYSYSYSSSYSYSNAE